MFKRIFKRSVNPGIKLLERGDFVLETNGTDVIDVTFVNTCYAEAGDKIRIRVNPIIQVKN